MKKKNIQTLKGFRDFLPNEKRKRDFVVSKVKETFELFGFEPLETPTLEYANVLLGKYGEEADKMVYTFKDKGGRLLGLRYDQTVPTARILAQYKESISKGFRRYQIQNVFRADKPQRGRYREFTQCDIDIFGTKSPLADAEIIACTYSAFKNVGFPKVILKLNDRQILFNTLSKFSTKSVSVLSIIQTIDKLDKVGKENVINELKVKGLTSGNALEAINAIKKAKISENLTTIIKLATQLGVPKKDLQYSPSLARGLDYYTDMIFEVYIPKYDMGSFGGGGRYNNLIEQLGGPKTPAVGIAFGLDRMVEAADKMGLIKSDSGKTKILVTIFSEDLLVQSIKVANILRDSGINTEVYPDYEVRLDKQLKYADKKGVPYVVIIGPEEAQKGKVVLKNLKTGKQNTMDTKTIIKKLS